MIPEPDETVIQLIKDHHTISTYYSQLIEKENENYHSKNRKRLAELSV
jgi:IS1 family transposase